MKVNRAYLFFTILVSIIVDRFSKYIVHSFYSDKYIKNEGIFFGLIREFEGLIFLILIVGIILTIFLTKNLDFSKKANAVGFGLILSGAISNLADRIYYGYIIDFIKLDGWPIFNLADIWIVLGVTVMIYMSIKVKRSADIKKGKHGLSQM